MANYSRLKLVEEERHSALGSVLESAERYCHRLPDRLRLHLETFRKVGTLIGESRSSSTGLLNSRGATQTHVNLQPTQQKHKLRLSHTSRHFLRDRVY